MCILILYVLSYTTRFNQRLCTAKTWSFLSSHLIMWLLTLSKSMESLDGFFHWLYFNSNKVLFKQDDRILNNVDKTKETNCYFVQFRHFDPTHNAHQTTTNLNLADSEMTNLCGLACLNLLKMNVRALHNFILLPWVNLLIGVIPLELNYSIQNDAITITEEGWPPWAEPEQCHDAGCGLNTRWPHGGSYC